MYAGQLAALLFLPFGFAWVLGEHAVVQRTVREPWTRKVRARELAVGLVPIAILLVIAVLPGSRAQWFANLGAVSQARAELGQFRWPLWQIQDELRRDEKIDLSQAEGFYNRALAANPDNVTALRRLGQIAVSRGDWQLAQSHLEHGYSLEQEQNGIRQLLGEVYAVTGRLDAAATLWGTVDNRQQQLQARQWWYSYINDPAAAANVQAALEASEK
ncbi:MAG: hypothetical protein IPK16_11135 [Anaerolineales bacterium]|nr:hypothetical protein [Anaerolineales bacterium]